MCRNERLLKQLPAWVSLRKADSGWELRIIPPRTSFQKESSFNSLDSRVLVSCFSSTKTVQSGEKKKKDIFFSGAFLRANVARFHSVSFAYGKGAWLSSRPPTINTIKRQSRLHDCGRTRTANRNPRFTHICFA